VELPQPDKKSLRLQAWMMRCLVDVDAFEHRVPCGDYKSGAAFSERTAAEHSFQGAAERLRRVLRYQQMGDAAQVRRNFDTECVRSFEVDHQFVLVGACTGKSAGFSPLRMRLTYSAAPTRLLRHVITRP
jgi:hypothetical protein